MVHSHIPFEMDPALLLAVIRKQAGSLDKALLEAVMNSIDAGASSVSITLTPEFVTIDDDGRGFRGADEVRQFFARFGTPHQEGDSIYGKFRMGRGQMFSFGRNSWRTGTFLMDVDINVTIGFELFEELEDSPGCQIKIDLYEHLSIPELYAVKKSLAKMVKYSQIPVYLNGEQISVEVEEKNFPQTIEEAFINTEKTNTGGVEVYNLGVYVCTFPAYQFGISGTVISRKQLDVNFARNQVLGSCPIWKRIKQVIDSSGAKKVTEKQELTQAERENIINRLMDGSLKAYQVKKSKFLTDVTGKHWSPSSIKRKKFIHYSVAPSGDAIGDRIMQRNQAFVLSQECADLFAEFGVSVDQIMNRLQDYDVLPSYKPLEFFSEDMNDEHYILPSDEWKKAEKAWMKVAEHMFAYLRRDNYRMRRRFFVGQSDVADGWTDGSSYIAINRGFMSGLKMFKDGMANPSAFMSMLMLVAHEMCHDTDSRDNIHSPDFYRAFHDLVSREGHVALSYTMKWMTPARYKTLTGAYESTEEVVMIATDENLVTA